MSRIPVDFTGTRETMLLTLLAKARESRLPHSVLRDTFAAGALDKIDYDFARLRLLRVADTWLAVRAKLFDDATRDFLARHPDATVVHMGCGLDTRILRVDPAARVRWYDVDYPDTVTVRRKLYPPRANYQLLGTSLTDPSWVGRIRAGRPTLLLAEGVSPYLDPASGVALLQNLVDHFGTGELVLDIYSRFAERWLRWYRAFRVTGAKFTWPIQGPEDLTGPIPRLIHLADLHLEDLSAIPWLYGRYAFHFMRLPLMREIGRIVRFRF